MTSPVAEGWITTDDAAALTGYARATVRRLVGQGQVEARKVGRDWLVNRESLLAYRGRMDELGNERHNPWRGELVQQGRGRKRE